MMRPESTKVRALNEGRRLLQTFGFNAFSFQHIADKLGIKKPSLFEHYKSKEELGRSVIESYRNDFETWTQSVNELTPTKKVAALFNIFCAFSEDHGKVCPLSAVMADFNSLPRAMQKEIPQLFEFQKSWLTKVIREGQAKGDFNKSRADKLSETILALAFGAQLISRSLKDSEKIKDAKKQALALLSL